MTNISICENPVFVLGAPRSGTSMMQWALRQHPNLWGGQESDYLIPLYKALDDVHAFGSRREKLHWLSGQKVDIDEFYRHVGYGINSLYTSRSKGLRWVEQTPQYTLHLPAMQRLFPGAQFLFMLRDGRSVVSSLRKFVNPVEHLEACKIWQRFVTAGLEFQESSVGSSLKFISYEGAVNDTEAEMGGLFEFIREPHEPNSVTYIRTNRPINSSFAGEVSSDKTSQRWTSWNQEEREQFRMIAGDLLIQFGFESDDTWVSDESELL